MKCKQQETIYTDAKCFHKLCDKLGLLLLFWFRFHAVSFTLPSVSLFVFRFDLQRKN